MSQESEVVTKTMLAFQAMWQAQWDETVRRMKHGQKFAPLGKASKPKLSR